MKIFLSPHNDDETLFGAYTIMREKPLVVIITDSHIQEDRGELYCDWITRRKETLKAMKIIGAEVAFLGIPDSKISETEIRMALINVLEIGDPKELKVFAPMIEGGNPIHDMVGKVAGEMFENVEYYSTYTKTRAYPEADIEIKPTDHEWLTKLKMLECYNSQKNLHSTKIYFQYAERNNEYRSLLCCLPKTA